MSAATGEIFQSVWRAEGVIIDPGGEIRFVGGSCTTEIVLCSGLWWMKNLSPEVEKTIDAICALGCTVVSGYILALQKGELRPEYQSLNEIQRASLLQELQSIMSVYEGKCR